MASNNAHSPSTIAFDGPDHGLPFGEVLLFFIAHLPSDLSTSLSTVSSGRRTGHNSISAGIYPRI